MFDYPFAPCSFKAKSLNTPVLRLSPFYANSRLFLVQVQAIAIRVGNRCKAAPGRFINTAGFNPFRLQVGHIAPSHRSRINHRDRLERAMALLDDPALDALVSNSVPFHELPDALPRIWSSATLPPIVCY